MPRWPSVRLVLRLAVAVLAASPVCQAATPEQITQAVDSGVKFVKSQQAANGTWAYKDYDGGVTALAGLALLESGVARDDPSLVRCRQAMLTGARELRRTYSISLAILFLDRLADREGNRQLSPTITGLGNLLLQGQLDNGRWSYYCPRDQNPIGDNSNTQFALLALWAAGRQGVNVAAALDRVTQRFRATQYPVDGGWQYYDFRYTFPRQKCNGCGYAGCPGYHESDPSSTASMTCAGLLSLAVARGQAILQAGQGGVKKNERPLLEDAAIVAGLKCLSNLRDSYAEDHYFLWSLERTGVVLGVKEIGGGDWCEWGAELLVRRQAANGSWTDNQYSQNPVVGTCFALLFLRRSDLIPELTSTLRTERREATHPAASQQTELSTRIPKAAGSPEALLEELSTATERRQMEILHRLRDEKGSEYTEALLAAHGKLKGRAKQAAAEALTDRAARMTVRTLQSWVADEDAALRIAAIKASAQKKSLEIVPDLIDALTHADDATAREAKQALLKLTDQDFGPAASAGSKDRMAAQKAWRAWWAKQPSGK